jgi:hypothetical protein
MAMGGAFAVGEVWVRAQGESLQQVARGAEPRDSGLGARGSWTRGSGLGARGSWTRDSGLGARGSGLGARGSGLGARSRRTSLPGH